MTDLLDTLNNIQSDFDTPDIQWGYDDCGEMYLRTYMATGSLAAVVQGDVSTFNGFIGGAAYLANYVFSG